LNKIHVAGAHNVAGRLIDGAAEIDRDDSSGEPRDLSGMAAHAAAGIEDVAAAQHRKVETAEVIVEVRLARLAPVVEVSPLVPEAGLRAPGPLVLGDADESWNTVQNRHAAVARLARERIIRASRPWILPERRMTGVASKERKKVRPHQLSDDGMRAADGAMLNRLDHAIN
jgi:hypothetical protein